MSRSVYFLKKTNSFPSDCSGAPFARPAGPLAPAVKPSQQALSCNANRVRTKRNGVRVSAQRGRPGLGTQQTSCLFQNGRSRTPFPFVAKLHRGTNALAIAWILLFAPKTSWSKTKKMKLRRRKCVRGNRDIKRGKLIRREYFVSCFT